MSILPSTGSSFHENRKQAKRAPTLENRKASQVQESETKEETAQGSAVAEKGQTTDNMCTGCAHVGWEVQAATLCTRGDAFSYPHPSFEKRVARIRQQSGPNQKPCSGFFVCLKKKESNVCFSPKSLLLAPSFPGNRDIQPATVPIERCETRAL
jgi:hypothetical protein